MVVHTYIGVLWNSQPDHLFTYIFLNHWVVVVTLCPAQLLYLVVYMFYNLLTAATIVRSSNSLLHQHGFKAAFSLYMPLICVKG